MKPHHGLFSFGAACANSGISQKKEPMKPNIVHFIMTGMLVSILSACGGQATEPP